MQDYTELKKVYRARIDLYSSGKTYLSNKTFDSYEYAWNYAKEESKKFGVCGFCVIECDEPQLTFNIDFSGGNNV